MSVRALAGTDWTFGKSKRNLLYGDDEIAQNVVTRIKSFKNDWFLDTEAEIDWLNILSSKNNKQTIINNIIRVTEATTGVLNVTNVDVLVTGRYAAITLLYNTINNDNIKQDITI